MLFDTHVHLQKISTKWNFDNVLATVTKAKSEGVAMMVTNGYDSSSSKLGVEIANKINEVYATVGLHPLDINDDFEEELDKIEDLIKEKKVVAIGEIGLDYYYDKSVEVKEKQAVVFKKQLAWARKYNLPVTIHMRDATQDVYEILKTSGVKGIMHCYSSSLEMAYKFIELGFLISISGVVTFKNAKEAKRVAKEIPLKYLVLETDTPFLAPTPFRGKPNEPAYLRYVCEMISELREDSFENIAKQTFLNACKMYGVKL